MQNFPIFEDSNLESKLNVITYSDQLEADQYIDQFLNLVNAANDIPTKEPKVHSIRQIPVYDEEEIKEQLKSKPKPLKKSRSQCSFHNFQKHLALTIKYEIDLKYLQIEDALQGCAMKIWECFRNSNKLNKTMLSLLLNGLNKESSSQVCEYGFKQGLNSRVYGINSNAIENRVKVFFGPILEEYPPEMIEKSHLRLKQFLISELRWMDMSRIVEKRRIKHKKEFILYYQQFLTDVQKGTLGRRISQCVRLINRVNPKY